MLAAGGSFFAVLWTPAVWAVIGSLVLLGGMLIAYPFSTPQTIRWLGTQRSRRLARGVAVLCLVLASWMAVSVQQAM